MRWAVAHRIGGAGLRTAALHATDVDQRLRAYYRLRPYDMPLSVIWHVAALTWSILPAYYFLTFVTGGASMSLATAIVCLGIWFNLVTFALPVDFGVQETTRVIVFSILGFNSAAGLTYGITLRLEQLVWACAGLAVYVVLVRRDRERGIGPWWATAKPGLSAAREREQGGHMETHVEAFFVSRMWQLPGAAACCIALLVLFAGAARAQSGGEKTVLGLTDMIRMAVAFSPEMAEKRSASASAKSDLAQARAGFLPQIDTVGLLGPVNDAKRPEVAGNRIIDPSSSYWSIGVFGKLNVMMTQPIYTFGKISNRRDAAEQGVAARQAQESADGQRDRPTRRQALRAPGASPEDAGWSTVPLFTPFYSHQRRYDSHQRTSPANCRRTAKG